MKKIVAIALMFVAAVAWAKGYKDWFTPQKGWDKEKVDVHIQLGASDAMDFTCPVTANLGGIVKDLKNMSADVPQTAKNAYNISISALANSIFAACQAKMNEVKIDNLGAALEGVFVSTYGQYVDEDGNVISKSKSGVNTAKLRQQLLANKNAVVSGGQAAGGSEANPLTLVITQKPYDESQFEQHVADGKSLTSLKGWYNLSDTKTTELDGADGWALAYNRYFIPVSSGKSSTLGWVKWNGWEEGCLSAGDDVEGGSNDKPLRLYGWTTANNCSDSIQNLLTNETATLDRSRHKILTRYDDGSGATIHWMKFDESVICGGSEQEADDHSIVYTQDKDADPDDPKKFRLKGFDAAKPAQDTSGAVLPFVDAKSKDLQWGSIMGFFADSVFRQSSETGKILLNGTSEEGKVKVLAMTGKGGDDQTISALTFDNASIDGNPAVGGIVQLHGFDTAPSPYASGDVSFADVLTNTTTQITGMSVPVRIPAKGTSSGATVAYVPMGKIAGIPAAAVDNNTIEVNEADPQNKFLQLHGAAGEGITLKEGDVYQIGSDGKGKFAKLGAESDDAKVSAENASIESYTGDDGGKYFRLRDWMINREGIPHIIGWSEHALKYWTVDGSNGIDINSDMSSEQIMLSGYLDAAEGAIPYAKKDGNGLGWLQGVDGRVPLLHKDGAPTSMAIGSSLDKSNVSAVPTLNVSGFTAGGNCSVSLNKMLSDPSETSNRSAHQFMARYSNGGEPSVHWVGIDDIIAGGGAPVDDASITTNTTHGAVTSGNASIYGFADAPTGTVPIIAKENGKNVLKWGCPGNFGLTATKSGNSWTYAVSGGYIILARTAKFVSSSLNVSSTGNVYIKFTMGSTETAVVEHSTSSIPKSDSTYTYIPLYYLDVGGSVYDYRGAPQIQMWE